MTDIHQWRRMIQATRSKTPAVETEESDGFLSPTTPRKGLKPKLSSYFVNSGSSAERSKTDVQSDDDLFRRDVPVLSIQDLNPSPNADNLVDSVMARLLAEPYKGLDPRFNGILLQIFESFRSLSDLKNQLQVDIEHESERRSSVERAMQEGARQWDRERQEYKAEVKRLELILASGEKGLAEVTLARQNSLLHHKRRDWNEVGKERTLETIFEFLERTKRYEDRLWSSQRATMRKRPSSPSAAMRRLSKTLTDRSMMSNVYGDLPFGTPSDVSLLEQTRSTTERAGERSVNHVDPTLNLRTSEPRASCSDDSHSTFSCAGDLLPDELGDDSPFRGASSDTDFAAMKKIALMLAKRRHLDPDTIIPKLQQLFKPNTNEALREKEKHGVVPNGLGIELPRAAFVSAGHVANDTNLAKHPRLKTKASEFFSKWKPQLNIDTSSHLRRFSFEPGDDTEASLSASPLDNLPASVRDRLLRKSMSLSFLSEAAASRGPRVEQPLSPVQQSPTPSAPASESRKPSRIPTPVHGGSKSLARPRQERENSASSLLTAIKQADEAASRSDSMSSSAFSSPNGFQFDLTREFQGTENIQDGGAKAANGNPLLEHTNALRGSALSAAAAKTASTLDSNADPGNPRNSPHDKYDRVLDSVDSCQTSTQSRVTADMSEHRKENNRPMTIPDNSVDHRGDATL